MSIKLLTFYVSHLSIVLLEAKLEISRKFRTGTLPPLLTSNRGELMLDQIVLLEERSVKLKDKITNYLLKTWH